MRLIDADSLLENYNLNDATKYGNKNAKQQNHSYSTMYLYEIADMIEDAPTIEAVPVAHVLEELEKEVEWASTHGTDKMFRDGRLSGLRTAKRIVGGADIRKKV